MKGASTSRTVLAWRLDGTIPPAGGENAFSPIGAAATLQEAICEAAVQSAVATYSDKLKAVVLTGSLARHEGTFFREGDCWIQFGDSEFLLVFEEKAKLPLSEDLFVVQETIESELLRHGLKCRVSLAAVLPTYLRRLQPHIFAYELLTCGRVLWGEPVISLIPRFSSAAIPLEDAWRLLCNRMIELLEVSVGITDELREVPKEVFYQSVKLYIDMGTSFLVFAGGYEPTYEGRAERMRSLQAQSSTANSCPLNLARFAERVVACTQYKLSGAAKLQLPDWGRDSNSLALWKEVVADAHLLWRWELSQLTATKEALTDRELIGRWMRQQSVVQRARGWLFVLRREGWHRSWRKWLNWARCAVRGSPRYCVYAAASEALFKIRSLVAEDLKTGAGEKTITEILSWLPAHCATPHPTPGWRHVAAEIVWNYRLFLVGTRS